MLTLNNIIQDTSLASLAGFELLIARAISILARQRKKPLDAPYILGHETLWQTANP